MIIETTKFIHQSDANVGVKKLFDKITYLSFPSRNKINAGKGFVWVREFHVPFRSMIYLLLTFNSISEQNFIESIFQWQVNHGPDEMWNFP